MNRKKINSSDCRDETNITCWDFEDDGTMGFGPKPHVIKKKGYARIYPLEKKKIRKVLKQRKEIGEGRTWVKHKIVCVMRDERQRRSHANVIAKVVSLLHPVSDGDFFSMALSHSCRHNWLVRRSFP